MEQQKSAVIEGDAPPKQVALAIERLGKASRLFAEIRLGVDRLLEVVIDLSEQETKTALDLIVKGDSSIRCHFQDLLILGKQLEEFGVLNESLRSRGDSWGLHMPLVCPDGAVVAYAWKRQLAGQAGASAVDRTRLALKAFTDQKKRFFSHLQDESSGQTYGSDLSISKKRASREDSESFGEHKNLSDVLFSLQKEASYMNVFTYKRLDWRKIASSLTDVKNIDSLKEKNSLGSVSMNEVAIIELFVPSVFRAFISLHPAGSTNPDSVAFFSPDEEGNHIHPNGKSLFHVFKYIKEHADRALQYFCGVNRNASLSLLLNWICSYRTLYSQSCCGCGRILFMESVRVLLPPVYRSYLQSSSLKFSSFQTPKNEQSSERISAYHIGCYVDERL